MARGHRDGLCTRGARAGNVVRRVANDSQRGARAENRVRVAPRFAAEIAALDMAFAENTEAKKRKKPGQFKFTTPPCIAGEQCNTVRGVCRKTRK